VSPPPRHRIKARGKLVLGRKEPHSLTSWWLLPWAAPDPFCVMVKERGSLLTSTCTNNAMIEGNRRG
jgi:hypothetical protein